MATRVGRIIGCRRATTPISSIARGPAARPTIPTPLFTAQTPWGITTIPLEFDPPVKDASEIKTKDVPGENGAQGYKLQADPPRKLKNLQGIPSIYVVAERSGRNGVPVVAFLKQAGVDAEAFNLKDKGVLGNGHFMMLETNRRQVFDLLKGWVETKVKA